jgi:bacterial/archaeal transporter family-2 protein
MIYIFLTAAVLIGSMMPIQAGINAELTRLLKHPYLGALVSFLIGTLTLTLLSLFHGLPLGELKRLTQAPPSLFLGGLLGALFVGSSIFLIPRLGATPMIAAFVTGQLMMSVCIDHYGLLGLPVTPITLTRLVGVALLFTGLMLVLRKA